MPAPVFATGDVPSADQVNTWFVNILHTRKTAAQGVASSTALVDDDALFLSVPAGASYELTGVIIYDGAAASDLKIGWSGPSGAVLWFVANTLGAAATLYTDDQAFVGEMTSTPTFGAIAPGTNSPLAIQGLLVTGGNAGTFRFRFAQAATSGTQTRVMPYSYLTLRRVA